jgi:uncharacterized protein involved in response to NO
MAIVPVAAIITHSLVFLLCVTALIFDFGIPPMSSYLVLLLFTVVNLGAAAGLVLRRTWGRYLSIGFFGIHGLINAYSAVRFFLEYNKPVESLLGFAAIVIFFLLMAGLLARRSVSPYFTT